MADEIGQAMQKVGGTAGALKIPFEEVSSWIAVVSSRTRQSATTIGDSVKSILARVQSLKETGYDAADNTDVNQVSKALKTIGVQLVDSQGQFRNFGTVMNEIGAKWKDLDARQKAYIATTVAGTYQQSNFLNLMEGYKDAVNLTSQALDSAGTAQKKFQLYEQGTEAQLNKLKATWEGVWMSAFKSSDLQMAIQGINGIAVGVKFIVDNFGLLAPVLAASTLALVGFNTKVKESLIALNTNIKTSITQFGLLNTSLIRAGDAISISSTRSRILSTGMLNLSMVARSAGVAVEFLGGAMKTAFSFLATTALPVVAIMAVGYGIQKLTEYISNQRQEEASLKAQQVDLVNSYKNHQSEISKLADEYDNLSKIKNKTSSEEKQYTDIQNQLVKLLPSISAGENSKGDAIIKSSSAIRDQIKLLQQQVDLEKQKKNLDNPQNIVNNVSQLSDLQKQLDADKKHTDYFANVVKESKADKDNHAQILWEMQQENEWQLKQANVQNQINGILQKNGTLIKNYFSGSKIDSSSITQISSVLGQMDLKGKDMGEVDTLFKSISDSVNDLNKALKSSDTKAIKDAESSLGSLGVKGSQLKEILSILKDAQNQHSKSAKDGSSAMNDEAKSVDDLNKALSNAKGSFTDTENAIMDMIKSKQLDMAVSASQNQLYSEMSDKLSPVNQALENLANGQSLTAASAIDLIQKVPEMTKYLSIQNGQVQVNTQGIVDWRDAQVAAFQDAIKAEKAQIDAQASGLKTKLKNYGVEIQAILSVADANKALAEAQDQYNQKMNALNNSPDAMHASMIGGQNSLTDQYKSLTDGINSIKDAYNNLDQLSGMASTGLTQVGTSMEKTSSATQQSTYVTDKYKQSMDQLTTALEKLKNLQQQYPNYSKTYRDALQQEIDLLKQQKDLTDAQAKNLQGQISSGIIQQTGMITSSGSSSSGSSSSSTNYNYASGGSTQAQIWNFLKGKGLSDSAIAGIMGNLQQESGFSTTARNPNGATGLAQWMGGRLSNLQSQSNWSSLDTQLNYLWSEWAPMMSNYGASAFNNLNASQAAYIFEKLFERSGGDANAKRQSYANQIYSQFAGSAGTPVSSSSSSGSSNASNSAAQQAQAIDQAKSDLLGLQQTSSDLQNQIQDIYLQMVQSQTAYYDHIKNQYDSQIAQYDYLQNVEDKNSANWLHTQMNREAAYTQQIQTEQQSIDFIKQQIAYNSQLNEAQKATLSDDVLQRQQDLLSLEQKLLDTRSQMADEIVNTYKTALQDMKDASTKSIDNMINDINKQADQASYQKKLTDVQKSAQDIQDQITQLSLDDSTAAKKKIADLQKQLSDQNDSISQMVTDNAKQTQIDNLNAQKDAVSTYYDNMLNDEDKFAQMRTDILNVNNQNVINSLKSLSTQVQQNVNILGTSVVNTLIDAVNRANGYLNLSTANSSVIGHIASLDSGGITPSWGSSGKLAVLHQDEMISNKVDTNNFLKSINLVKDMVTNIFKPANLSGVISPATAGGNNYYVNFNVDKMTGNQSDVNNFITKFVNGVKAKGGVI